MLFNCQQRTVRERQADYSRGAVRPGVIRVLCEFVFRLISICRVGGFRLEEVGRTVRLGWPDSPRGSDRPQCSPEPSVIQGALLEVLFSFSNHPPVIRGLSAVPRGPSAQSLRTVRLVSCRAAKFFASCVLLSLWDCLGFVPRVGRFVVTM
jgi:hypothetical protein